MKKFVMILLIIFTLSPISLYAETWNTSAVFNYSPPEGWRQDSTRERWLGEDPTLSFRQGNALIRVTHYGLTDSKFQSPAEFRDWLKKLFETRTMKSENISLAGKTAERIRLEYSYEGHTDHHGAYMPPEFIKEEFIILPLDKGFLVLNINIHQMEPEFYTESEKDQKEIFDKWEQFLKSISLNQQGA